MQHAPSEVFYYTDTRGHSDTILLSKSCTILHAAKKDLLGLLQLQVRTRDNPLDALPASVPSRLRRDLLRTSRAWTRRRPGGRGGVKLQLSDVVLLLQDPSLLEGRVTLHHVKAGSVVARQGDQVKQRPPVDQSAPAPSPNPRPSFPPVPPSGGEHPVRHLRPPPRVSADDRP